jgi:hypothetical protein
MRSLLRTLNLGLFLIAGCANAPPPSLGSQTATEKSCASDIGVQAASKLVRQCLQVSPATHPPCNVQNSCVMVRDEIKRGCDFIEEGKPSFCGS